MSSRTKTNCFDLFAAFQQIVADTEYRNQRYLSESQLAALWLEIVTTSTTKWENLF